MNQEGSRILDVYRPWNLEVHDQMFRLDDIIFRAADQFLCEPYLFKIDPRYAQIYGTYGILKTCSRL